MKKSMLFAAAAVVAMVGCTNEDFTGFQQGQNGESAINFGTGTKKLTRAENITGKDAADLLKNNFVVYGFKSVDEVDVTTYTEKIEVFDHYSVNYGVGTAGSTESNTHNWEYVGQEMSGLQTNAKTQTIKYWDFSKKQYDFVAFSKGSNTADYSTLFSKVAPENIGTAEPVYTVTGTVEELQNCYVADLVTADPVIYAKDLKAVTPVFRKMASKVRLGIYETIPGYSVKDVKFYTEETAAADMKASTTKDVKATLFASDAIFPDKNSKGVMKVTFPTIGNNKPEEAKNKAFIEFTAESGATQETTLTFDKLTYDKEELYEETGEYLGRTSATASYAGDYIPVLPKNTQNVIKLQVDYTLVSIDGSKEDITVYGATAEVPAIYTEWQPNYAYTYLFKISDQTNGLIDPSLTDPLLVGLYPITFDAMVMNDENGIQETITEIGKPSITTYQKGKVVTENDEYVKSDSIYVVVNEADMLAMETDLWKAGAVQLFKATTTNSIQTITEEAAANCIENGFDPTFEKDSYGIDEVGGGKLTLAPTSLLKVTGIIPSVNAPHGVDIKKSKKIAVFQPAEATTYVFQYMTAAAVPDDDPSKNTLKAGVNYWTIKETTVGNKTTYTPVPVTAAGTAVGNEIVTSDPKYVEELPDWTSSSYITSPATMKTGAIYYTEDTDGNIIEYKADGTETNDATYKSGTPTKIAAGTTIAADGVYYVYNKSTSTYTKTVNGATAITVKATDQFYTMPDTWGTPNYGYLKTGDNYFYKEGDVYVKIEAKGDEAWADNKYVNETAFTPNYVELGECTTMNKDLDYYTIDSTTGKWTKVANTGAEPLENTYVTCKTPAKYAYKVIKVVE